MSHDVLLLSMSRESRRVGFRGVLVSPPTASALAPRRPTADDDAHHAHIGKPAGKLDDNAYEAN